jgi:undecaprenyl-phosphate galactose phosphotransferase
LLATTLATPFCALALLIGDGVAFVAAGGTTLLIRIVCGGQTVAPVYPAAVGPAAVLFVALAGCLALKGRYSDRIPFWSELRVLLSAALLTASAVLAVAEVSEGVRGFWAAMVTLLLFPAPALAAGRIARHVLLRSGLWTRKVLVVGTATDALHVERALHADRALGYHVVRRMDPTAAMATSALRALLHGHGARMLVIADGHTLTGPILNAALRSRIPCAVVPQWVALSHASAEAASFLSHDAMLMAIRDGAQRPLERAAKIVVDLVGAALLLVLTAPLFLLIAVANLLDGGPVFFVHRRVGINGRSFPCLKFRTMRVDGDRVLAAALAANPALAAEWAATRKLRVDPRVTRIGRFVRKTSFDELPQLINVLRLEMSLVGPRPIVQSEVALFGPEIAAYYTARPGLTGLWQVSGRSNTSYARRVQLDAWYVHNWSFWNDIALLLKTVPALLSREGAH